jgi:hypothetical protein
MFKPHFSLFLCVNASVGIQTHSCRIITKVILHFTTWAQLVGNCDIRFIFQLSKFYETKQNEIS